MLLLQVPLATPTQKTRRDGSCWRCAVATFGRCACVRGRPVVMAAGDDTHYTIDRILDVRKGKKGLEFRVRCMWGDVGGACPC